MQFLCIKVFFNMPVNIIMTGIQVVHEAGGLLFNECGAFPLFGAVCE